MTILRVENRAIHQTLKNKTKQTNKKVPTSVLLKTAMEPCLVTVAWLLEPDRLV